MLHDVCVLHVIVESVVRVARIVENCRVINIRQIILALNHSDVFVRPHALVGGPNAQIVLHYTGNPDLWIGRGYKVHIDTHFECKWVKVDIVMLLTIVDETWVKFVYWLILWFFRVVHHKVVLWQVF